MTRQFTIYGEPVAKQRPRVCKSGHTYTPEKTVNYCNMVKSAYIASNGCIPKLIDFPIAVKIVAYFNCPKSNRNKTGMKNALKSTKPDVDNIAKSILDALNKIAWVDDGLVYECTVSKLYTLENPRCDVIIIW